MNQPLRVAAIYTTYCPDDAFRSRIAHVVEHCDTTIVVDNTPGGHSFTPEQSKGLVIVQDGFNKGLGKALNAGIHVARELDNDIVVLFDQDSSPSSAFIKSLLKGLEKAGANAVVGPKLMDDASPEDVVVCGEPQLVEVSCLATSGMAFRTDGLEPDDGFTEEFFLDFVDFDWCWRMRAKGWRTYRLESLPMLHRLGLAQRSFLGLTYHVPAPYRHYFQFRDTLRLTARTYVPTYSRWRLRLILLPKLLVYPFLLDRGMERLSWMLRGIRDAVRAVPGIGAAAVKLQGSTTSAP